MMTIKQKLHHKKQHNMTPHHQHQKAPHQFLTPPRNTPTIRLHVSHQRPGDIPDNQQETQPCGRCERDPLDEGRWYEAEYSGEDVGYEGVAVEGDDVDEGDGLGLGLVADQAVDDEVEDGGEGECEEEEDVEGVEEVVDVEFYVVDGFVSVEEFSGVGGYREKHNQRHTNPKRSVQIRPLPLLLQNPLQKMIRNVREREAPHHPLLNILRVHVKVLLEVRHIEARFHRLEASSPTAAVGGVRSGGRLRLLLLLLLLLLLGEAVVHGAGADVARVDRFEAHVIGVDCEIGYWIRLLLLLLLLLLMLMLLGVVKLILFRIVGGIVGWHHGAIGGAAMPLF